MSEHYIGLDLTASARRPTSFAVLDEGRRLVGLGELKSDAELLALVEAYREAWVGVDAPLGLPRGLHCLERACPCASQPDHAFRACEAELRRRGIPCFYTVKGSIIAPMVYRAVRLRRQWEAQGVPVLEVFPYAVKVVLWGRAAVRQMGRKTTASGLARLRAALARELPQVRWEAWDWSHDRCDALLCAYTVALYRCGEAEAIGDADEGQLVLPRRTGAVAPEVGAL